MSVRIIQGDALEVLRTLPSESVHTCCTSPPYWGLRCYGVPPSIWGGDPACEHEWGDVLPPKPGRGNKPGDIASSGLTNPERQDKIVRASDSGAFCRCGAWRGTFGLEPTPALYVEHAVMVFREVRRVLRDDGTLWLNLGSSYAGSWGNYHPDSPPGKHGQRLKETARWNRPAYESQEFLPPSANVQGFKPKDMVPIPWMVAMALQADGWYLRQDIIWAKPNPMPESVRDRCTKSHEYLFLLAKSEKYYCDMEAISEPAMPEHFARYNYPVNVGPKEVAGSGRPGGASNTGGMKTLREFRNKRSVWTVATQPFKEAHFATFPPALIEPCILAGCPAGGTVLDPFFGAGTTGLVSDRLQRSCIGIELNETYAAMAEKRIKGDSPLFAEVAA